MPKLAINGGEKAVQNAHIEWPEISEDDKRRVMEALDSRILWGAYAPRVKKLQEEWADYVGAKHCVATNSGTSALHIAVAAAGIGPGDEVITSSLTFVASALAILQSNAIPVFVDIDPLTYCIDPAKIEPKITRNTKAIIPVHLHGMPADMDEINRIAKKHNLIVIEDACQAHGATYRGRRTGTLGDMAAFSLNGSKNLPGGEGGLFTTDDDGFRKKAQMVRDLGEIIEDGIERDYNAFAIGWMYRYQEMAAAFVLGRIKRLDEENAIRNSNAEYLTEKLRELDGILPPAVPDDRTSAFHLYRIRFDPKALGLDISAKLFRAKVQKALRAEGLQANRWQNRPVPMQNLFQARTGYGDGCPWTCPYGQGRKVEYRLEDYAETQKVVDDSIVIHSAIYPPNGRKLLDQYFAAFRKVWDNLDELQDISFAPGEIYIRD